MLLTSNFVPQITFSLDPLNLIGMVLTCVFSLYFFKAQFSSSYVQERHEKLIFPLFDALEPVLYQKLDQKYLDKALFIIEENKSFADGAILDCYYSCKTYPSQESFVELCSCIDHAFDKSCCKLKLRKRSFAYRINKKQYRNKLSLAFYFFVFSLPTIFSYIFVLCAFFLLLQFADSHIDTMEPTILFITTLFVSFCMLILKLLE